MVRVVEELDEKIREFKLMTRLDSEYGNVLLDASDWDLGFKSYDR